MIPLPQALDGDFSEENRNKCHVATSPLIQAVENLSTFANNPEFASIPAQISHEVGVRGICVQDVAFFILEIIGKTIKICFISSQPNLKCTFVQRQEGKVFVMYWCMQFPEKQCPSR